MTDPRYVVNPALNKAFNKRLAAEQRVVDRMLYDEDGNLKPDGHKEVTKYALRGLVRDNG